MTLAVAPTAQGKLADMQKSVKRFKKSKIPHRWYCEVSVGVVPLISQGQERKQLQVAFVRLKAT